MSESLREPRGSKSYFNKEGMRNILKRNRCLQDPKKRKWVDSLAADVVYVSGRKRPGGEMNGKSGNINNVCSQLYPPGTVVPGNELICIFDADQVTYLLGLHCRLQCCAQALLSLVGETR